MRGSKVLSVTLVYVQNRKAKKVQVLKSIGSSPATQGQGGKEWLDLLESGALLAVEQLQKCSFARDAAEQNLNQEYLKDEQDPIVPQALANYERTASNVIKSNRMAITNLPGHIAF